MKPNISKNEIESGKEILEKLVKLNSKFLPHHLKEIIPGYKNFSPHISKYGLWSSTKTKTKKFNQKYKKIFLLFNGVAAGGKDAIKEEMNRLIPNLFFTAVTGTSRQPREGEIHKKDYYFFNGPNDFKKALKNGEFIEYVQQGDRFYGLPKKSLDQALKNPSPIIYSQLELSAWTKMEKYLSQTNEIGIIKIFVLPHMNFTEYQNWLNQKRDDEVNVRLMRTCWEIKKAPKKADFIVTNRIAENSNFLTFTAQTIINQLLDFLPDLPNISKFDLPFKIDQEISDVEKIIEFHDSIK